jgi:DNA-binding MarR family transcriptional regulator
MTSAPPTGRKATTLTEQVETMLAASRVLVGISAASLVAVEDIVSVAQFRVLVIIESRGSIGLQPLARAMGVHPSNASRACDRLVALALLDRRDNPDDRRYLALELTQAGHDLINTVMTTRRNEVRKILQRMAPTDRDQLAHMLRMFAIAGGETDPEHLWSLGWSTAPR